MMRYVVFDVETPNRLNDRMSAIGITVIEDDRIVDSFYSLVNPETYFDSFNKRLTGIDEFMVANAPSFDLLWEKIEPFFNSGMIVAHNAAFDMNVLKKCLTYFIIISIGNLMSIICVQFKWAGCFCQGLAISLMICVLIMIFV